MATESYDKLILMWSDGRYKVIAPPEKFFADKTLLYCAKADRDRVMTVIYAADGFTYVKRFTTGGTILDKEYLVAYCYPDNIDPEKDYGYPPLPAQDWVTMNGVPIQTTVTVPANSQVEVPIELSIPENALVPNQKWEFWISAMELNQQGMVQVRYCQRWLVTMRD